MQILCDDAEVASVFEAVKQPNHVVSGVAICSSKRSQYCEFRTNRLFCLA